EKERLIKEGKIKRPKKSKATSDKPHYENVPFEVPSSWVWTTLGDIAEIITGNTPSKDIKEYYSGNIPFFKPTDLEQGIHTKYSKDRLTPLGFEQSRKLPANSVLVTCIGATIGKTGLTTVEGTCNQQINAIIPTSAILAKFLFYVCISDYMQHEIKANASATTLPILNKANFSKIAITIPPLQEQSRIVKSIEHWLSLVDCIDGNKENLQKTIREAKSKILTLAIHGKLVPQDPTDEPASELLKRINPKAEITSDNGHYQKLPERWCETQLGDIFNHNTGKALNSSNTEGTLKDYLTTSNVYWNSFDFSVIKKMLFKESELNKCQITKGDLLVCEGGDIGRAAIWDYDYDICIQNHLHRLRPKVNGLCVSFYYYVLYYLKINNMIGGKGIGLLGLSSNALHKLHVPFPPLNEQHRIVAKIEDIFAQLDAIEASL
ncbi:restriction endonuclease subunit S, partial [Prevotella sp.]|uniref:restriction endonuclease subunit S n=1 Tax=Prevotella sp. TaxID=59823 RepID=UPI00307C244D